MKFTIGIIGVGNMGSAIAQALQEYAVADELWLCDHDAEELAAFAGAHTHTTRDPRELVANCDVVILAVKPQSFAEVAMQIEHQTFCHCEEPSDEAIPNMNGIATPRLRSELAMTSKIFSSNLTISIMAGISIAQIREATGTTRIIRAMPNLAAQVGESMTGWVATPEATADDREVAKQIFAAMGKEIELSEESAIDAITALSGSGPAYFFYLCELLAQKAEAMGFDAQQARVIAEQTLIGAGKALESNTKSAAEWRAAVTSKGGTTQAALQILQSNRFTQTFSEAINAARERAKELSGKGSSRQGSNNNDYSSSGAERSREVPMIEALTHVRAACTKLSLVQKEKVDKVLRALAAKVRSSKSVLLAENAKDLAAMDRNDPRYDRLELTDTRLEAIAADIETVAGLPSPLGRVLEERMLPNGLHLQKVSVPIGVVGVIYEARPNVTFDVFALCFKSGNACVLKGGKEAGHSNSAIVALIQEVLKEQGITPDVVCLTPKEREATDELLRARDFIDVIIPRGSQALIEYVRELSRIPMIETGAGIVHTYFDVSGDLQMGKKIIENAKTRRYSVCNALDTLIVHVDRLKDLPALVAPLVAHGVELFADERAYAVLVNDRQKLSFSGEAKLHTNANEVSPGGPYPPHLLHPVCPEHFGKEFLCPKMAIKTVANLDAALAHIARYGSKHSEAIIATDQTTIDRFLCEVDAAVVYANASTAFTDGGQFGMGAEIGISTQKLHARGPMALPELTTYKWLVRGTGQTRPK